ncbi:hypothetical protein ANO14919_133450 [Xylariales sp. No.14919]|nr:hypothetical protein ANO14919_133450 [Xylariales sp. No.14919]
MKLSALLFPAVALAAACPYGAFQPERPIDSRSVCPMLNILVNHGSLPRSGGNITEARPVKSFSDTLNIDQEFGQVFFTAGRVANSQLNATTFDLEHVNIHNLFEYDRSLRYTNFPTTRRKSQ